MVSVDPTSSQNRGNWSQFGVKMKAVRVKIVSIGVGIEAVGADFVSLVSQISGI